MDKVLIHVKKTAQVRAFGKLPSLSSEIALVKDYKIAKIKTGERLRFSHYAAELRHIGMKHPQLPVSLRIRLNSRSHAITSLT